MDDTIFIPSIAQTDAMIRGRGTPVHPGALPDLFIPPSDVETKFNPDTGELLIQCYSRPLPVDVEMRKILSDSRRRGFVKSCTVAILGSVLQGDMNQLAWLMSKGFTRTLDAKIFGGQLAYEKVWPQKAAR
jgi:hypothetical protein